MQVRGAHLQGNAELTPNRTGDDVVVVVKYYIAVFCITLRLPNFREGRVPSIFFFFIFIRGFFLGTAKNSNKNLIYLLFLLLLSLSFLPLYPPLPPNCWSCTPGRLPMFRDLSMAMVSLSTSILSVLMAETSGT